MDELLSLLYKLSNFIVIGSLYSDVIVTSGTPLDKKVPPSIYIISSSMS
jgi:hypothetical protein